MQMIHCPNCGTMSGFKRSLGFGTLFAVLLTAGLWLLAIPFYPVRCIKCGLARGDASGGTKPVLIVAGIIVIVLILLIPRKGPEYTPQTDIDSAKPSSTGVPAVPVSPATATTRSSYAPSSSEANDPVDTYHPCVEATQRLRVPEQVDLDLPGDFSSAKEPSPQFTFLFSDQGIDVYAVRTNKFGPAGYHRLALLVFQDEKVRREILRSYITSGLVQWAYSDAGTQDWKPVVNFKYVTLDFAWSHRETGWEPWVQTTVFYAPPACNYDCENVPASVGCHPPLSRHRVPSDQGLHGDSSSRARDRCSVARVGYPKDRAQLNS
jgi:hypothetical protein